MVTQYSLFKVGKKSAETRAYDTSLKVSCESHLRKKLSQENLRKFLVKVLLYMTHLQVEQRKLQVKSGVSRALLWCDSGWPITTRRFAKENFQE